MNRPKQEDFIEWDRFGDGHINSVRYAEALDKYCDELEDRLNGGNVMRDLLVITISLNS